MSRAVRKKKPRRARSDEAKQLRRADILKAAQRLLDRHGYDEITVDAIARSTRLAKGTVYLYFPTKETIFLEVLLDELERWFAELGAPLERIEAGDERAVATLLATSMAEHLTLRSLLSLLHSTLEQNVDRDSVRSFKVRGAAAMAPMGTALERRLPRLRVGDGMRLLKHVHALVVGVGHVSTVSEVVADVLSEPALAPFRVDFVTDLRELIELMLAGWR